MTSLPWSPRFSVGVEAADVKTVAETTMDQRYTSVVATPKAIYIYKLPQLGHTTGRNSYWLANAARLLDAILTPEQRMISYQYCRTGHLFRTHRARPVHTCTRLLPIHTARVHGRGYTHVHGYFYGPYARP